MSKVRSVRTKHRKLQQQ